MVNWRSGDLTITLTTRTGTVYDLKTVQSLDPVPVDNIEIFDSLTQQRLGYHFNPRRLRLTMVVLPSTYVVNGKLLSDASILSSLASALLGDNYLDGIFDLNVDDRHDGIKYLLGECVVTQGSTGTIAVDAKPATQFVVEVLKPRIIDDKDPAAFQDYDDGTIVGEDVKYAVF